MGYISRYIKEHYVRRNIRRDLYDRFIGHVKYIERSLGLEDW